MQVLHRAEQVVDDVLGMLHLQVDIALDDLLKITLGVLHHDVESVEFLWVFRVEQLDQLYDEWVLQLAHQGDLAKNALAVRLIFKNVLHPLDCDLLSSAFLDSESNLSIAARPQQSLTGVVAAHIPIVELVLVQA